MPQRREQSRTGHLDGQRIDAGEFLRRLAKSGLVNDHQLHKVTAWAHQISDGERLAVQLVAKEFLTRWHARQLLAGNRGNFFIGHYKLEKEIGRGAMGTVYRALHLTMSRLVALKVMSTKFLEDNRAIK